MKKQTTENIGNTMSKQGNVKMGFVIQNNPQGSNIPRKQRSVSPQSQNQNTLNNQVGQLESQQSASVRTLKHEKKYISQLETQMRVQNKKKNDLASNNSNLENLLRLQDQKIQTFIEEIKQLRNYNDQLFKENKQLHLRVEGFASEKNHILTDNKLLKETIKKMEVRLSLPVRPQQRKNVLKTVSDFSRENNYIDGTLLANEQILQQYGHSNNGLSGQQQQQPLFSQDIQNINMNRSNSPNKQDNHYLNEGNQSLQHGSLRDIYQGKNSQSSFQQQAVYNGVMNNNQMGFSSPNSSQHSKQLDQKQNPQQNQPYFSQINSARSSNQFQQIQQLQGSSAHFNNNINNQSSSLFTTTIGEQGNKEMYMKKLEEQIKVFEDERESFQYEIKLLNQALSKDSSNEPMQKLIKDLAESQQRITKFTKNQSFLEDKISQFEKLVDSFTQNSPYEMDRGSLEKKNAFLLNENASLSARIEELQEEIKLWQSNRHPQQIEQQEQEEEEEENNLRSNYLSTHTSRRGEDKISYKGKNQVLRSISNPSRKSSSLTNNSGILSQKQQPKYQSDKLSLGVSIKNQKINRKGGDKLDNCCKEVKKKVNNKSQRIDSNGSLLLQQNSSSRYSQDVDETNRLLQVEKQKNILLQKMVNEEQEKNSEYLVYKEEIDYYHQKNKQLKQDMLQLQSHLNEIQFSNKAIKVPLASTQNANQYSPRQLSLSPHQVKRVCNTIPSYGGNFKRQQQLSPNQRGSSPGSPSHGILNYEPRSPPQSARNMSYCSDSDQQEGNKQRRASGTGQNKANKVCFKNGTINIDEQSDIVLAYLQIEKELKQELQKKEKQIDNIINSRNLMQKTLGDQLKIIKGQNKELEENNRHLENSVKIINQELKSLRILVKRAEKKNLIGDDFIPSD